MIDASLGLTVALPMFVQYQESGVLQAKVAHVPSARDGWCSITIYAGKIQSCVIVDRRREQQRVPLDAVIQADKKRGPFEWVFLPHTTSPQMSESQPIPFSQPSPPVASQAIAPLVSNGYVVPVRARRELDLEWLSSVTREQKRIVGMVFALIDGKRSIAQIKAMLPRLSARTIEQTLVVLMAMQFIFLKER